MLRSVLDGWQDEDWTNFTLSATMTPLFAEAYGIAGHASGMKRCDALLIRSGRVQLVRVDGQEQVLAEAALGLGDCEPTELYLEFHGNRRRAWVNDRLVVDMMAPGAGAGGAAAFVIERDTVLADNLCIGPVR